MLVQAAEEGRSADVERMLDDQGADMKYRELALAKALLGPHVSVVSLLLSRGIRAHGLVLSCALERGEDRGGDWEKCAALLAQFHAGS